MVILWLYWLLVVVAAAAAAAVLVIMKTKSDKPFDLLRHKLFPLTDTA